MSAAALTVQMYGPMLFSSAAEVIELPTVKTRLLLAYLLLNGPRAVSRRALVALFWPDMTEPRGLANLSTLLTIVRRAVPPQFKDLIVADAQHVRLTGQLLDSDVARVDRLLERVERHRHRSVAQCLICVADLRQVRRLLCGPLLDGLNLLDHEQLQVWIDTTRERHLQRTMTVYDALLGHAVLMQAWPDVIELAEHMLLDVPWHEPALQRLMHAYALSGQRLKALQRYEQFRQRLVQDLAGEPLPELQQLAAELQRGVLPPPPPVHCAVPESERLFGRAAELRALYDALGQTQNRLVTISGFGGVGKTLLAQTALRHLAPLYRDGVVFVALDGIDDVGHVMPAIAQACGIRLSGRQPAHQQVVKALTMREMLLLLDNVRRRRDAAV